ncbi:hypothetical protein GIS00_15295 [Nakamurella sp. YIM 132087]|uniref:SdpI family protein n=1 Tax=Nakamurella alba TaxID=2665158 RepID=A0A7K1FMC1_9ACTN|nr:SdpI family protein [Nakamurella alba]MTD15307.1 hypothetical protein [Nakamurella alba]
MNSPLALTIPLAVVLMVVAAGAATVAHGGWNGSLRREGRLGVRTRAAVASDHAFETANKVAAPIYGGAAGVALTVGLLVLVLPMNTVGIVVVGLLGLVAVVVLTAAAAATGERVARTLPVPARRATGAGAGCGGCACGGGGCAGLTRTSDTGTATV